MRAGLYHSLLIAAALAAPSPGSAASRTHGRVLWLPLLATPAASQGVMKFEPLSAESAAVLEKRTGRRPARIAIPPASEAETPPSPSEPESPEPPPEVSRGGDVVRIGSDIHVERGQVIEGDVFALRGDIRVEGHVKGNVATTGGDVHLGSTAAVDGDVMCIGGELTEDPGAIVSGPRVTVLRGRGVRRFGRRLREKLAGRDWEGRRHGGGAIGFSFSWLLMSLLVTWAFTRIAPARTGVAMTSLLQKPGSSLGLGLVLVMLLAPSLVALALAMVIL